MRNREEFGQFLSMKGLLGKGVELGTYKGEFAKTILSTWSGKLYMIDVWRELTTSEYDDVSNNFDPKEIYTEAIESIKGYEERAFMIRSRGEQAVSLFPDNSLDFVYIDANHSYEGCSRDIRDWYPKVKPGGLMCGHDYLKLQCYNKDNYSKGERNFPIYAFRNGDPNDPVYSGIFGVNPAVEEFCEEMGYTFNVTEEWAATWYFFKR